jgi:thiol-disulfide isomerase/thioredoxin
LLTTLLLLLLATGPTAAQLPRDSLISHFEPDAEFTLELGGESVDAQIFFCQKASAYLIVPADGDWMLLSAQTQKIYRVDSGIAMRRNGRIDLFSDAITGELASYDTLNQLIFWTLPNGTEAKLRPRPWMLGSVSVDDLAKNPAYAYKAGEYEPDAADVEALQGAGEVRVKVYFGSWCPFCKGIVPRVLRLSQELAGSTIHFEYYGLPRPMTDDPAVAADGITSVPTAVVFVGNEEKGRLDGRALRKPEAALRSLLEGS